MVGVSLRPGDVRAESESVCVGGCWGLAGESGRVGVSWSEKSSEVDV